jgi:UDP-N-acetylmuramate-alanine ligase
LADADILFIGEIYPSRETPAQAGNFSDSPNPQETLARHLVEQIAMHHPDLDVSYVGTIDEAPLLIDPFLVAGDVLITMGAGDGVFVGEQIVYRRGRGGDGFSPIV